MVENNDVELLQKTELELLKKISNILEENHIDFFLACGSILGCIRHKGFIPWDDDIDIYIFGKDYEKVKFVLSNREKEGFAFHDYSTIDKYPYTFPKIVDINTTLVEESLKHLDYTAGIYIDIFPLMEVPNDLNKMKKIEKKRFWYYCLLKAYYFQFTGVKKILNLLAHIFVKPNLVQKKLKKLYCLSFQNCEFLIDTGTFEEQAKLNSFWFDKVKYMPFEDTNMPIPYYFDNYLRAYYGDYLKLPPIEERKSNHHFSKIEIKKS